MKNFSNILFISMIVLFFFSTTSHSEESIKIEMGKLNHRFFPKISFDASITYRGEPVRNLTKKDFSLYEDKIHIKDFSIIIRRAPINIGMVLDSSGSIKRFVSYIKNGANSFIDMMKDRDKALLVKFSGNVIFSQKLTSDKDSLKVAVSGLYPNGGTKLYDGIYRGIKELSGKQKCLILFTDGKDEKNPGDTEPYSIHPIKEVVKLARNKKIPIFVIGIGDEVDKNLLSNIAKATGGKFYFSKDPSKIIDIYKRISLYLNYKYKFSYITPNLKKDNKWRIVKIEELRKKNEAHRRYRIGNKHKIYKISKDGNIIFISNNDKKRRNNCNNNLKVKGKFGVKIKSPRLKNKKLTSPHMDKFKKLKAPHYKRGKDLEAPELPGFVPKEYQEDLDNTYRDVNEGNKKFEEEHNKNMDKTMNEVNDSRDNLTDNFNDSMDDTMDDVNNDNENLKDDFNNSMDDFDNNSNDELNNLGF